MNGAPSHSWFSINNGSTKLAFSKLSPPTFPVPSPVAPAPLHLNAVLITPPLSGSPAKASYGLIGPVL